MTSAQELSLQRYDLSDRLTRLVNDLAEEVPVPVLDGVEGHEAKGGRSETILSQLEGLQDELRRLEGSLAWIGVLERVVLLRYVKPLYNARQC